VVIARPRTKLYAEHHTVIVLLFGLSETVRYCVKTPPTHRQNFFNSFSLVIPVFTAWCYAQRGIAKPRQFVCLSVCLSVTLRYRRHIGWIYFENKIMFKEHRLCPMLSLTLFGIFASKYIWVTILTFQGHATSPVTWPFDTPRAISYRWSIVTKSLSSAIFETIGPKNIDDVIGHVTNRSAICHFPLVSHWNRVYIFNRFRDIWPPNPVRAHTASDFIFCRMQCIALDRQ